MKKIILILVGLAVAISATAGNDKGEKEVEPFDRGIGTDGNVFIPAGSIGTGATFSYTNYSVGNGADDSGYSMFLNLLQNVNGTLQTYGISPHVSYFFWNNMSLGAKFSYNHSSLGVDSLDLVLDDDSSLSVENYNYMKDAYVGTIFFRDYIPFGNSKRFAMFVELRASGGYAQAKSYETGYDETLCIPYKDGYYQDIYDFEIGVVPGLIAFLTNEVALEVSVGLMGFEYEKVKQVKNQVEKSELEHSGANFKINILSVSLGLSFYIPTNGRKYQNRNKNL